MNASFPATVSIAKAIQLEALLAEFLGHSPTRDDATADTLAYFIKFVCDKFDAQPRLADVTLDDVDQLFRRVERRMLRPARDARTVDVTLSWVGR